MAHRSVTLLEFNELTPRLMDRFLAEGHLPNFRRFRAESQVFLTDAKEQGLNLNPWIQWVTVHCGQPFSEHGVYLLGEGGKLRAPHIADVVSHAGLPSLLCGSMNIRHHEGFRGVAIPDAWAVDVDPQPSELEPFTRFVQHHVQEHTNSESRLGLSELSAFVFFMLRHGLSGDTIGAVLRQLWRERGGRFGWQRVGILDRIQFDVFQHYRAKERPAFATFFSNAVAHLQHTRWRNLEPDRFSIRPSEAEQREFREAVLFAYEENDHLVGKILEAADPDEVVIFCTALSQEPDLRWEEQGGKTFYRPRDFYELTKFAGISAHHECSPVMSQEFWVDFESESDAAQGELALKSLLVDGRPAFHTERRGRGVNAGCILFQSVASEARLTSADGRETRFLDLVYQADTLKSGVHNPLGMLWIRLPERRHQVHETPVALTSVAPTVLGLLGLAAPPSMHAPRLL